MGSSGRCDRCCGAQGGRAGGRRRARQPKQVRYQPSTHITFRVIASTMDFATNYFVVRDVGLALILSASGLVFGSFVYVGHEKAWEYFSTPREGADLPALLLPPAPR